MEKLRKVLAAAKDVADSYRHLDDLGFVQALDEAAESYEASYGEE